MIDCLLHAPNWGAGPQPRHTPWLGIEPATFCFGAKGALYSNTSLFFALIPTFSQPNVHLTAVRENRESWGSHRTASAANNLVS